MNTKTSPDVPTPVVVHLSGRQRGSTRRLQGDRLWIGSDQEADIQVTSTAGATVAARHALLLRSEHGYRLETIDQQPVWVNGERVESRELGSGDLLEIGEGGPVLRFRLYPAGAPAYKTLSEALEDCVGCAQHGARSPLRRAAVFLAGAPVELLTQTRHSVRAGLVLLLAGLIVGMVALAWRGQQLEAKLATERTRIQDIAQLLEHAASSSITLDDLSRVRTELDRALDDRLGSAETRLGALEDRADAQMRVISAAAKAVVFVQGSYGFLDPVSRKPLRLAVGQDGKPVASATGAPAVTFEEGGPLVERTYSGTAFVNGDQGLLVTNRHVALPWEFDEVAAQVVARGLEPTHYRFVGYLPGEVEEFEIELVAASQNADLAILRCSGVTGRVASLELRAVPASAGEEVIVLGYPTGLQALLARVDRRVLESLFEESSGVDFWEVARRLAKNGLIGPLATRGIVGQVTGSHVVYDAQTTGGGSGGPVVDLEGRVVAVNSAVLVDFGGSNLGVPAAEVLSLLEQAR